MIFCKFRCSQVSINHDLVKDRIVMIDRWEDGEDV